MITIITLFSTIVIACIIFKFEKGVGLFLLYCLLVPTSGLNFGTSITIGSNFIAALLLVIAFVKFSNREGAQIVPTTMLFPFLCLYLIKFFLIFFHFGKMPVIDQLDYFRIDVMRMFLPFVIIYCVSANNKYSEFFTRIIYVAVAVSSLYSIFLLPKFGLNPYIESIRPLLSFDWELDQDLVFSEGVRLFGYISSVFPFVTEYGAFLIFSTTFLLYQINKDRTLVPRILLVLLVFCALFCGARSVLLALVTVFAAYLLFQREFAVLMYALIIFAVVSIIIHLVLPDYINFVLSIGDDSIHGSSIDMRIDQFKGCLKAIQDNPIFGLGYGWTGWYRSTYGRHPDMLGFESILIQTLCHDGFFGVILLVLLVLFVFKQIQKTFPYDKDMKKSVGLLFVGYFVYSFFTGDYGMFRIMLCYYAIIIANGLQKKTVNNILISKE